MAQSFWSAALPEGPTRSGRRSIRTRPCQVWSSAAFPKAVVGLSGVYDLTLREPPPTQHFIDDIDNYTNTIEHNFIGWEVQYSASPISYVYMATNQTAPARLYATESDPLPHQQAENMMSAL